MNAISRQDIRIRHDILPGDLGRVVELHGELYASEFGFDYRFEAYVAYTLGTFASSAESGDGRLWLAEAGGDRLVGCVGVVLREDWSAQLRWLIVHPDARGKSLGRHFVQLTITWAEQAGCQSLFLWTVHPLSAAIRLYQASGFQLTEETAYQSMWGCELREQRYERALSPVGNG